MRPRNQNTVNENSTRSCVHCAGRSGWVSLLSRDCLVRPGGPPRSRDYMFSPWQATSMCDTMTTSSFIEQPGACKSVGENSRHSWRAKGRLPREAHFVRGTDHRKGPHLSAETRAKMPRPSPVPRHKVGLLANLPTGISGMGGRT